MYVIGPNYMFVPGFPNYPIVCPDPKPFYIALRNIVFSLFLNVKNEVFLAFNNTSDVNTDSMYVLKHIIYSFW